MNNKQVLTIVAGCIVCIMCGFTLGYVTGSGMLPGGSLSGSGMPPMSGQQMDMASRIMQMQSQRAGMLDQQLADQMAQTTERNNLIKKFQEMISQLKSIAAGSENVDIDPIRQFCSENDIAFPAVSENGTLGKGEAESLISALTNKMDILNNDNQLDMIRLQSLIDKRNQAFEMMSNTLQKDTQTRNSIVGNMR